MENNLTFSQIIITSMNDSIAYQENTKNRIISDCKVKIHGYRKYITITSDCDGWAENKSILKDIHIDVEFDPQSIIGLSEFDADSKIHSIIQLQPIYDYISKVEAGEKFFESWGYTKWSSKFWYINGDLISFGPDRVRELIKDCPDIGEFGTGLSKHIESQYTKAEREYKYMSGHKRNDEFYQVVSYSKDRIVCERSYNEIISPAKPFIVPLNSGSFLYSPLLGESEKTVRQKEIVIFE